MFLVIVDELMCADVLCVCVQVLGDLEEFEHAVQLVLRDVNFNSDVIVSVFETNIRVLGCVFTYVCFV